MRYFYNLSFSCNPFILVSLFLLPESFLSSVAPERMPGIPPDIEAVRNFGEYELDDKQKEFLKSPIIPDEGRVQVTYPKSEGETFRIRITAPKKDGFTKPDEARSYLSKYAHVIGFEPDSNGLRFVEHHTVAGKQSIWIFQQYLQSVPIESARVILRANPGYRPHTVTGIYFRSIPITNREILSEDEAIKAALDGLNEKLEAITHVEGTLVLFPYDKGLRRAFRLDLETKKGPFLIFIDAETSKTLQRTFQLLPANKTL